MHRDRHPLGARRVVTVLAAASLSALAGCGRGDGDDARASTTLVASLDALLRSSTVESTVESTIEGEANVERADATPAGAEPESTGDRVTVIDLRDGIARIRVRFTPEQGQRVQRGEREFVLWELPAAAALQRGASPDVARVELLDGTSVDVGSTPDPGGHPAESFFGRAFLDQQSLTALAPSGPFELLEFDLVYSAVAARVATLGLLDGESARDVLLRTCYEPGRAWTQLEVPVGLRMRLPELPVGALSGFTRSQPTAPTTAPPPSADGDPSEDAPADLFEPVVLLGALQDGVIEPRSEDLILVEPWVADLSAARDREPPSVLVLVLDTLRADRVGPWRGAPSLTPELDALLSESIVWQTAWSTSPWTLPAIATLLTGRHAAGHGAFHRTARMSRGVTTLGELFHSSGYRTAAFTDGGFFHTAFGLERGFSHFDYGSEGLDDSTPRLTRWLDRSPGDPFFAVLHTYEVHEPYAPEGPGREAALAGLSREERFFAAMPGELAAAREEGLVDAGPLSPELIDVMERLYDLEVEGLDRRLGLLFEALEQRGLFDDLIVAVVADHGEEFGEHNLAGHSDTLFPEILHVPLAIRLPGGRDARTITAPVSILDFAPTVVDAAGLPQPVWDEAVSLLEERDPSPIYAWRQPHGDGRPLRALRSADRLFTSGDFRFERGLRSTGLYDLSIDPGALDNLLGDDESSEQLRARWFDELEALVARFGEPGPVEDGNLDAETEAQLQALGYR